MKPLTKVKTVPAPLSWASSWPWAASDPPALISLNVKLYITLALACQANNPLNATTTAPTPQRGSPKNIPKLFFINAFSLYCILLYKQHYVSELDFRVKRGDAFILAGRISILKGPNTTGVAGESSTVPLKIRAWDGH